MAPPLPPSPIGFKLTASVTPVIVIELFQDVCCPFSKKMYNTIDAELIPKLQEKKIADRIAFMWQSVPQPWHAQGCLMHDAVMAAYLVDSTNIASYLRSLFSYQKEFFDDATKHLSRMEIYSRLIAIGDQCGYDPAAISAKLDLDRVEGNSGLGEVTQNLKWAVKYHRGRGIHMTPTVFINGLEASDVSSDWSAEDWMAKLDPILW